MRLAARALAVVATAGLIATGIATPALAAGSVAASPSNHFNDGASFTLTLTTGGTYVPGAPNVNVKLTGPAGDTKTVTGTVTATHTVTATLNLLDMNQGTYGIDVAIGSTATDQCASCFTVNGYAPLATSVSPATLAEGTSGGGFNGFTIQGQNFTHGPYTQCTTSCTAPYIQVVKHGGTFDTNVHLSETTPTATPTTETSITKRISIDAGPETAAYDDDIVVVSAAGKTATCSSCLHVLPQPKISSVVLKLADSTTMSQIGANATHQTIVITGTNLQPDTAVAFIAPPPSPGPPPGPSFGSISFASSSAPSGGNQTITVTDVDTTQATASDSWGIVLTSPATHGSSAQTTFPVKPAPSPTGLTYAPGANSTTNPGDVGQGATGTSVTVAGDNLERTDASHGTRVVFTSLPAQVTLKTQVVSVASGSGTVSVPMDVGTGAATGTYAFHLVNPDGGTSPDCDNSSLVPPPPVPNSCFLTIASGPTITSVSPATVTGGFGQPNGTTVVITGTGFHTANGAVHVLIGPDSSAGTFVDANVTAVSATRVDISVKVPNAETVQDVDVVVTNNDDGGKATAVDAFHVANLSVDSASPSSWTNDSTKTVQLNGSHLNATDTTVAWLVKAGQATLQGTSIATVAGGITASFDLNGVAPGVYDIKATNTSGSFLGTAVCTGCFTVVAAAPTASGASPSPIGGGAPDVAVDITGTNFFPGATVSFSNSHVHLVGTPTVTPTKVTQHVSVDGSATANTGTVTVTNTDGQSASTSFSVAPPPSVSSISPTSKAAGTSFTLTVSGSGFTTSTAPTLAFSQAGVSASGYAVNAGGTSLTASVTVAPSVTTGNPVAVVVTLINSDKGQAASPVNLTVNPQPVINSIDTGRTDPTSAPAGTSVTLHVNGAHFASGVTLAPDAVGSGLVLTNVTRVSDTEVDATVTVSSSAPAGPRTLDLANPDGGATSTQLFVITPSSAPRTLVATGDVRSADISWDAPSDTGGSAITSYTVTLTNADPNGTSPQPTDTSNLGVTVTGLDNGATYDVSVIATNGAGHSAAVTGTVTTDGFPDAPGGLSLTGGVHQIAAQWQAPTHDGGSPVTSYTVKAVNNADATDTRTSPALAGTSYTVSGLANGATYTVSVVATTLVGNSPATTGTATTANVPGAPTSVGATRGYRQLGVTWAAPGSTGGSPLTSYRVTAVNNANAGDTHDSGVLSNSTAAYTVTGLTDGETYTVSVYANNLAGQSAAAVVTQTTFAVPGAPRSVTATAGDKQVTVTWLAPVSDGGTPITGYQVTANPGNVVRSVSSVTPVTYTGLVNGTAYTFTVTATNLVGSTTSAAAGATPMGTSSVTLAALPSVVVAGSTITLSGQVTRTDVSVAIKPIVIRARYDNGTVFTLSGLAPSSTGAYSLKYAPRYDLAYSVVYPGDAKNKASVATPFRRVLAAAKVTASAPSGSHTVNQVITGSVFPSKAGSVVTLYRVSSTGSLVKLAAVKLSSTSTYRFSVRLAAGYTTLRVAIPATTNNAAGYVQFRAHRT